MHHHSIILNFPTEWLYVQKLLKMIVDSDDRGGRDREEEEDVFMHTQYNKKVVHIKFNEPSIFLSVKFLRISYNGDGFTFK